MRPPPIELVCTAADAGLRLDVFLARQLPGVSRSKLQKLAAGGGVAVNGKPARAKDPVAEGDRVTVERLEAEQPPGLEPVALPLSILFEDEHLIVIDKPPGLSVHPGAGETGPTLVHALLHHCRSLPRPVVRATSSAADQLAAERPGIVHRLDKDTSGVMVCAKTDVALAALARQFHDKTNDREYTALLDGRLERDEVTVESWIHRDPRMRTRMATTPLTQPPPKGARRAKSVLRADRVYKDRLTLARVRLFTGRTHQIRVHAALLRAPVLGDPVYHPPTTLPQAFGPEVRAAAAALTRQMLHARLLGFTHPADGRRLVFEAAPPADLAGLLRLLDLAETTG